jgi:transcriptional regulator with XRE-family HTH domain
VTENASEAIGARLRRLRTERGLSQRELSTLGVSYAYISRIEAGSRNPSVKALRMLAEKLGVPEEYLEYGERPVDNSYVESELRRLQRLFAGAGAEAQPREAQRIVDDLIEYMNDPETRAGVVERLAEEEQRRREFEELRSRFASDEQMREALGDALADQVVERLGERAASLRR